MRTFRVYHKMQGASPPEDIAADGYEIHSTGALLFYNLNVYEPDVVVSAFAPGTWAGFKEV